MRLLWAALLANVLARCDFKKEEEEKPARRLTSSIAGQTERRLYETQANFCQSSRERSQVLAFRSS